MFWHVKYRQVLSFHQNYWYHLTDDQLMAEYIAKHQNQQTLQELEELKNNIEYGCSDPRMHPLHQDQSEEASKEAERRIDDDFGILTGVLQSYVQEHRVLPYCVILHSLAYRYLGGGLLDPAHKDEEYPYRSSPLFTLMFWNLGNWCRSKFEKNVLFPKDFNSSFHTSTTALMKITTSSMRTSPSSTTTSSILLRTLEDISS